MLKRLTSGDSQISRKDYNDLVDSATRSSQSFLVGGDDTTVGNPIQSINIDPEQGCWGLITDYCRDGNNAALTDGTGQILYQWVEQRCDLSVGHVVWRNATALEGVRGSVSMGTGVYFHAAMELNNRLVSPLELPRVWLYPGFLNYDAHSNPDHRHVFSLSRGRLLNGTINSGNVTGGNFTVNNLSTADDITTTPAAGNASATVTIKNLANYSGANGATVTFSLLDLTPGNGGTGNNATLGHGQFIQGFC